MARLFSDLLDGSGRRFYFGLNSAPGGITNSAPAMLTINGTVASIQEQATVFRTPATAVLNLIGLSSAAEPHLQPAPAALAMFATAPSLLTLRVITNALPPDYTDPQDNLPTIIYIATISPAPAALQMQSLEHHVTQGGNIGFVSPSRGLLTLQGFGANFPRQTADAAQLALAGLAPTLRTEIRVTPDPAQLVASELNATLALPFVWVDEDPVAPSIWIDDPRA